MDIDTNQIHIPKGEARQLVEDLDAYAKDDSNPRHGTASYLAVKIRRRLEYLEDADGNLARDLCLHLDRDESWIVLTVWKKV